jgi:magnesium chelatase family protein
MISFRLPDNAIKESSYRIAAALKIMDIPCPVKDNHQHGSADLRKEGSAYDLTLTLEYW